MVDRRSDRPETPQQGRLLWIVLIVGSGICSTTVLACVTPFAALATLAALKLGRRDAAAVVGLVWLVNQAVGYGFLGYPWTWDSVAWGVVIGVSSGLAALAAKGLSTTQKAPLAVSLPFMGAFVVFQLSLYYAGHVLPGSEGAFSAAVIGHVFLINVAALFGLTVAYHSVALFGRARGTSTAIPVTAGATPVR